VHTFFLAGTHAMSSLNVGLHNHFQKSTADPSERSKLQIVSREPFSAFASFLLGMSADLAAATGLFVLFLR
jgi:hypothetical protein